MLIPVLPLTKRREALPVLVLLLSLAAQAQVRVDSIALGQGMVTLSWRDGHGPYLIETSPDLAAWSDLGEPADATTRTLPAFGSRSYYRVMDLDPAGQYGQPFGLIQTEQGEFGALLGRHRLKTRLWLYRTKGPPHTSPSPTPASYWRKLLVHYQRVEDGRVRTWSGPLEELGAVATPTSERLTITWARGSGPDLRNYVLTLGFPYPVNNPRTTPSFPSDARYKLECTYATPQPEINWWTPGLSTTTSDEIGLMQLDPANYPANPDHAWWVRRHVVSKNGAALNLHYFMGMPLYRGQPLWVLKTLLLDRWLSPTSGSGGSLPAFSTDSYFAQTLLPGHHNFFETVLIEPGLDPAISEATCAALLASNIRQIYALKDLGVGLNPDNLLYIGYDNSVRDP